MFIIPPDVSSLVFNRGVIPAKAGIQCFFRYTDKTSIFVLDSRVRGNDVTIRRFERPIN